MTQRSIFLSLSPVLIAEKATLDVLTVWELGVYVLCWNLKLFATFESIFLKKNHDFLSFTKYAVPGIHQKGLCRCSTSGHSLVVDLAGSDLQLDSIILKVFSNLNYSMITLDTLALESTMTMIVLPLPQH